MTHSVQFTSPWPAPQPLWADPPWILAGTSVTAWFETETAVVKELLSPSFVPSQGVDGVPTRLRFYDVEYEPRDGDGPFRLEFGGSFREAVIAFKGTIADIDGEFSAYMWTDDDRYMAWGREVFGWPLVRGDISLSGALWDPSATEGTISRLTQVGYALSVEVDPAVGTDLPSGAGPNWLTPRRIFFPATDGGDRRDLNIVQPTVLEPGRLREHRGRVDIQADKGSFLSRLSPLGDATIQSLTGFRICVGDRVETIIGRT